MIQTLTLILAAFAAAGVGLLLYWLWPMPEPEPDQWEIAISDALRDAWPQNGQEYDLYWDDGTN